MILCFADTHAYPGCRATLREGGNRAECRAQFADGTVVAAHARMEPDGLVVLVDAHRTRRGTPIPRRAWLLVPAGRGLRVRRRLAPPCCARRLTPAAAPRPSPPP